LGERKIRQKGEGGVRRVRRRRLKDAEKGRLRMRGGRAMRARERGDERKKNYQRELIMW